MQIIGIIPARYASTRFPGKPLIDIKGMTMIERVYRQASRSSVLTKVIVATDDKRIYDEVVRFGGEVMYTRETHQSGTDRCAEVLNTLTESGEKIDVVINIQGDEPFLHFEQIDTLGNCFKDSGITIATLIRKIDDSQEIFSPNCVKVVIDHHYNALYFSRNPIPFVRGEETERWIEKADFYKHIGIYAYTAQALRNLSALTPSFLEKTESLEQLRWLEAGYKINTSITPFENIAIDTPEDLQKIIEQL